MARIREIYVLVIFGLKNHVFKETKKSKFNGGINKITTDTNFSRPKLYRMFYASLSKYQKKSARLLSRCITFLYMINYSNF